MPGQDVAIDLSDADNYVTSDGMETFDWLRDNHPIYWNESRNVAPFWAVTRHRYAVQVFKTPDGFSSEQGMTVGQMDAAVTAAAGKMLIVTDDPRHRQLRAGMNSAFQTRAIALLEGGMRDAIGQALRRVTGAGEFDFVSQVATTIPIMAICQILGLAQSEWDLMVSLSRKAFGSTSAQEIVSDTDRLEANASLYDYFWTMIQQPHASERDDLVGQLLRMRIDGIGLSPDEIIMNILGFMTGGNETTRHASAGAALALANHPDQWRRLKEAPDTTVGAAVEEVLRWTAPSLNVMRTAVRDVTIGDTAIKAGERVSIWNPAVNRDPEVFAEPGRFDVQRTPNRHLTFGLGAHHCIGAMLARVELQTLLSAMTQHVANIEVAGPVKRLRSNLMWGIDVLPMRFN